MARTIILNDDNPGLLFGRKVRLIRPTGNFVKYYPVGTVGIIRGVSESGSIWIEGVEEEDDNIGWIRPDFAELVD